MTFDDFYMTNTLNKLKSFRNLGFNEKAEQEFLFAYNGTATKGIIIKQPSIRAEMVLDNELFKNYSSNFYLEQRFNISKSQLEDNKIRAYLISKQ